MEIIIGEKSGFCTGVLYTVKKAQELIDNSKEKIYCLGEIVHNERVISDLKEKGMVFVDDIQDVPDNSMVIFRAHGEKKEIYEIAKEKGLKIEDLTCGKIRIIRNKILEKKESGFIVIIGKKEHPETIGTFSYCEECGFVVENEGDILALCEKVKEQNKRKIYINSQTTFNLEKFDFLSELIKTNLADYEVEIDNTICRATADRQNETRELSKRVDKMIIIGGKNSSNTKELANVAKENCKEVFLISSSEELNVEDFVDCTSIGIMGGASTPEELVEEVVAIFSK